MLSSHLGHQADNHIPVSMEFLDEIRLGGATERGEIDGAHCIAVAWALGANPDVSRHTGHGRTGGERQNRAPAGMAAGALGGTRARGGKGKPGCLAIGQRRRILGGSRRDPTVSFARRYATEAESPRCVVLP